MTDEIVLFSYKCLVDKSLTMTF